MRRSNKIIIQIFIWKFVGNQEWFCSYWCQSGEGERRRMTFLSPYLAQLCWLFPSVFLGDAEGVFLLSSARNGSWSARMWNCWQLFQRKLILHLRLPLKPTGPGFEKSEMSLEISALSLFQGYCQSLALQAQMHRETSPSPESVVPFPLDGRFPTKCAERLPLALSTSLRKGKLSPTLSQAVTENRTGGVDLPSGCQSWHWRQRQQGAWDAVGDMIFSPAHPLGFPSTLLNQWHRSQAPRNS